MKEKTLNLICVNEKFNCIGFFIFVKYKQERRSRIYKCITPYVLKLMQLYRPIFAIIEITPYEY